MNTNRFYIKKTDLEKLLDISIKLSTTYNFNSLLNEIILEARKLTNADGGSIYLKTNNKLKFLVTQSDTQLKRYGKEGLKRMFKPSVMNIDENSVAGYCALTKKILNIENIQNPKKKYPFKYNNYWDKKYNYNTISLLTVPLVTHTNKLIGVLQLINAQDVNGSIIPFAKKFEPIVQALSSHAAIAIYNMQLNKELKEAYFDTITKLGIASEYRDKETYNHLNRMSNYTYILAKGLKYSESKAQNLKYAAMMHDVGKLGIPDSILQKPGKLTAEERKIMELHTVIGANILKGSNSHLLQKAAKIALTHHEKWDGTGYPLGLKGHKIPIEGRIVALADVFDALFSKRVYKEAFSIEKVLSILENQKGKHFDPKLIDILIKNLDKFLKINEKYKDSEEDLQKWGSFEKIKIDKKILKY